MKTMLKQARGPHRGTGFSEILRTLQTVYNDPFGVRRGVRQGDRRVLHELPLPSIMAKAAPLRPRRTTGRPISFMKGFPRPTGSVEGGGKGPVGEQPPGGKRPLWVQRKKRGL